MDQGASDELVGSSLNPREHEHQFAAEGAGISSLPSQKKSDRGLMPVSEQNTDSTGEDIDENPEWYMEHWNRGDPTTWTSPNGLSPSEVPDELLKIFLGDSGVNIQYERTVAHLVRQFLVGVSPDAFSIHSLQKFFGSAVRNSEGRNAWTSVVFHRETGGTTIQKNLSERQGVYTIITQLGSPPRSQTGVLSHNLYWNYPVWVEASNGGVAIECRVPEIMAEELKKDVGTVLMRHEFRVGAEDPDLDRITSFLTELSWSLIPPEGKNSEKDRVKATVNYFKRLRRQGQTNRKSRKGIPNKGESKKRPSSNVSGRGGRGTGPRRKKQTKKKTSLIAGVDYIDFNNPNVLADGIVVDVPEDQTIHGASSDMHPRRPTDETPHGIVGVYARGDV